MQIRVHVIDRSRNKNLSMVYRCPRTRKKVERSTGTTNRRDAERAAARWEDELNSATPTGDGSLAWGHFCDLLDERHLTGLAANTRHDYHGALDLLLKFCKPRQIRDVNSELLTEFVGCMRQAGREDETIRSRLAAIRASLTWAVDAGLLPYCPRMPRMPRRKQSAGGMKGRPLTDEEFDQLLTAVIPNVPPTHTTHWQRTLRGLWLSGLRLGEAINLTWQPSDGISIDLSGDHPMFWIPPKVDKNGQGRLLPITPDFAEFLCETPEDEHTGNVLAFPKEREGRHESVTVRFASRKISEFGKSAGIITSTHPERFATAHDLRRSFGVRWSRQVMPQVLQLLMRHSSIATTMKYYVGQDVQHAAEVLWSTEMGGNVGGNSSEGKKNESRKPL